MSERPNLEELKGFNANVVDEFRANGGRVGGPFEGAHLLLLTTTGAKSGRQTVSPLAYFRVDGKLLIAGSFRGADVNPAWVHNLRANSRARIEIGTDAYDVVARELPRPERDAIWTQLTNAAPGFAEYQQKTSRIIPLFELSAISSAAR